jgi:hypothetical protein
MSFGKGSVPDGYVVRTFRVKVMATPAKKARAYNLLVSGGDTWAWCIDRFHARIRDELPNANSMVQMWPEPEERRAGQAPVAQTLVGAGHLAQGRVRLVSGVRGPTAPGRAVYGPGLCQLGAGPVRRPPL